MPVPKAGTLKSVATQSMNGPLPEEPVVQDPQTVPVTKAAQRVIKKYPNRRLYDTATSTYITLSQVKQLVMERQPLVVRDAKTGEDITRSILLQIILEEESGGVPLFSAPSLSNLIRFYGQATQSIMGRTMEKNFQAMMEMQARMQEQRKVLSPDAWAQMMNPQSGLMQNWIGGYAEQSRSVYAQMQEQMLKAFALKK